jgi:hypothetical protein
MAVTAQQNSSGGRGSCDLGWKTVQGRKTFTTFRGAKRTRIVAEGQRAYALSTAEKVKKRTRGNKAQHNTAHSACACKQTRTV